MCIRDRGMSLLDIGCGWGFLLIEAAKKYKVHGTGITLSHEPVSYTHLDVYKRQLFSLSFVGPIAAAII